MTDVILRGPDVSAWQGAAIDWKAVKAAGASFAAAKCSEGVGYADPTFAGNWAGMKEAGLVRIAYHFTRPHLKNKPEDEAAWFLRCLGTPASGDLVALDVEEGDASDRLPDYVLTWLRAVERALGFKPLVYTYLSFARSYLQRQELGAYPLWLSLFDAPCPRSVPPWSEVALHQHTDSAVYPGIPGPCDESVIARTLDGLRALGKPAAGPPATAPSPIYHWATMTTDEYLRNLPRADSARLCDLPVGTVVPIIGPPTPSWTNVRAPDGQSGWILTSNARLSVQKPT